MKNGSGITAVMVMSVMWGTEGWGGSGTKTERRQVVGQAFTEEVVKAGESNRAEILVEPELDIRSEKFGPERGTPGTANILGGEVTRHSRHGKNYTGLQTRRSLKEHPATYLELEFEDGWYVREANIQKGKKVWEQVHTKGPRMQLVRETQWYPSGQKKYERANGMDREWDEQGALTKESKWSE